MQNELKPCPFCGGEAEIKLSDIKLHRGGLGIFIEASAGVKCKKCLFKHTSWTIRIPLDENNLELKSTLEAETKHIVEKWNRRANDSASDVVNITRCKDCKHFSKEASKVYNGHFCEVWLDYLKSDDFCSYGEKK